MRPEQKVIRNGVGLLELAKLLRNVSKACQMIGCSRDDEGNVASCTPHHPSNSDTRKSSRHRQGTGALRG